MGLWLVSFRLSPDFNTGTTLASFKHVGKKPFSKHALNSKHSAGARGGVKNTRLEAKAKDSLSEDRHSRGQGEECSRPRPRTKDTSASALQKKRSSQKFFRQSPKKKRSSQKFFRRSPQKKVFQKIFQALHIILTIQKILLSSSRGQANFRGLEASRPRPRPRT